VGKPNTTPQLRMAQFTIHNLLFIIALVMCARRALSNL
jgi:hypothetical protein